MKTPTHFSTCVLPMMLIVPLALAGCSDPQDIKFAGSKKDSGTSSTGTGSSGTAGSGADLINATGGSGPIATTGGSAGTGGSGGAGGASGSAISDDAGGSGEAAASPALAKLGILLFNADFEDTKTDKWIAYDGSIEIASGGAAASANALGFRTTKSGSIGKAVTSGASSATSFALEGDIMFQAGGQASLIFRVSMPSAGGPDSLTGYGVGLDAGAGNVWAAKFANAYSPLGSVPMPLDLLTWYHLRVDVRPTGFVVFLDGTFVMEVNSTDLTDGGMVGVRGDWGPIGDAGMAPEVLFDNVKQSTIAN